MQCLIDQQRKFFMKSTKLSLTWKYIWSTFLTFSIIISTAELYLNSRSGLEATNILKSLYHAFSLLTKLGSYTSLLVFNINSSEITHLLNLLSRKKELACANQRNKLFEDKLFAIFVLLCSVSLVVLSFLLPLVAFTLPCFHNNHFLSSYFNSCHSTSFRIYLWLTQMLYLLPMTTLGPVMAITCLVTLKEITMTLEFLR